jgi:hypothetical protein
MEGKDKQIKILEFYTQLHYHLKMKETLGVVVHICKPRQEDHKFKEI